MLDKTLLKKRMMESGINSLILAKSIGVSKTTISNVITGKHDPSFHVLDGMRYALNLNGDECLEMFFENWSDKCRHLDKGVS